jgi:tetratricopeptide (TPR) repeat protein
MLSVRHRSGAAVVAVLMLTAPFSVQAYFPKTEKEFSLLPPYCKVKLQEDKTPAWLAWRQRLGRGWIHIHHYCAGLNAINYARLGNTGALTEALKQMQYMHNQAGDGWPLAAEVWVTEADVYLMKKEPHLALPAARKAIELKPDYIQAYAKMSEAYAAMGDTAKAIETLQAGLKKKPDSRWLKGKLERLQSGAATAETEQGQPPQ